MANNIVYIPPVKDCSYIDIEANMAVHINNAFTNKNVFRISDTLKEEELPLLTYDFKSKKWLTGRYIGKLFFNYNNKEYCFEVIPRFGNAAVMQLLEEIFNIKLAHSKSKSNLENKVHNELIKKLISIIWVKQLSKANVHGLPKNRSKIEHKGLTVKGRIDIRKTVLPLYNESLIISNSIEKQTDPTIVAILHKAYKILVKDYFLSQNMLTDGVKEVINSAAGYKYKSITKNQYQSIKYGSMYANYKAIVDFSWQIIQRKNNNISQEQSKDTNDALFLDMAEIWESYLMNILRKKYRIGGWRVYSSKFNIYRNKDFSRGLIPDIILEKDNKVVVLDAKYKRMTTNYRDYDREDFFQIHTYGAFMQSQNKKVLGLGLIYPLLESFDQPQIESNFSHTLFGDSFSESWFKVDGIKLTESLEELTVQKEAFLSRFQTNLSMYYLA